MYIYEYAFQYSGLTSIHITSNVKLIGKAAFQSCYSLKSATFARDWADVYQGGVKIGTQYWYVASSSTATSGTQVGNFSLDSSFAASLRASALTGVGGSTNYSNYYWIFKEVR